MNRDFEGFVSEYTDEVGQDASKHTVYKVHIKMKENLSKNQFENMKVRD